MVIRARRLLLTNAGPDLDLDLDLLVVFTKSRGTASETLVYSIAKWAKHPYLFPHPPSSRVVRRGSMTKSTGSVEESGSGGKGSARHCLLI
jgi:hypothetical protein